MKFASALLVTALAALATVSYADLPVKCMYSDAVGTWTLHVQKEKWSSYKQCYMAWTGKSDLLPAGSAPSYDGEEQIYVQLNHPNNAIAKNSKGETFHGTWTLFYDEGFEITLNEFNGAKEAKFLSFFSFKKGCSGSGTCKTFLHNKWESQCQRTLNGWVHDADTGKWSCFWAEHTGTKTTLISEYYDPALLQVSSTGATKEQQENAESDRENEKYQSETEFVNFINSNGYSWKAKMYPELYADRTMKEMRMLGGYALAREKRLVRRVMDQYRAPILLENDEAAVEKLMNQKQFSWRNVGGIDYVAPVENQGACGSCYTFATVGMMESRIAIETARAAARKHLNREQKQAAAIELMEDWSAEQRDTILKHTVQTKLSEQHIVSCGPFTQGCSGGFSFTASKTVKDFGVTTAKCMPYIGKDGACPMRDECGNDLRPGHETDKSLADRVRFEDYTYVGGYYGGSDEKEMKRNIVMHGPVAAAFEVGRDILHYSSGVFRKRDNDERHDAPAVNAFSKTDHAILVVGWGEDDKGIKYWIVRNSWGPYWGENGQTFGSGEDERGQRGYFRIVRGVDHEGIESLPVSAVPVIPSDTDAFRSRFHVGWGQSVVPSSSSSSSSLGAAQGAAGSLEKLANSLGVSSSSSSKTSTKSAASSLDSDSLSGLMKEASAIGHLLAGSEKGKSAAGSASSETVEGIEKAVEEKLKQDSAIHEEFKREILGESGSTSHQTTLTESEKVKAKESATFRMLDNAYNTDKIDLGEIDDFDKMLDSLAESDVDTDDLDSDLE